MTCNNNLCIYEEDSTCSLDEISINEMGNCEDCTFIHLSVEQLEAAKSRLRNRMDEDYRELEEIVRKYNNYPNL